MDSELRSELLRRAEQDQAARLSVIGQRRDRELGWEPVFSVDADNMAWLKTVVAKVGWPGRSMVGEDGAHAAWLLAQHADRDPAFQRRCLNLLTDAVERGEASPAELAYLTDRVLLAEGQPQEYGTQAEGREDGYVPCRLRDPEHVDERRAAMSLGPLDEHLARMAETYGPPRPPTLICRECGADIPFWPLGEDEARHVSCGTCGWTATVTTKPVNPPPEAPDARRGPLAAN
jgi:hypothetical protein